MAEINKQYDYSKDLINDLVDGVVDFGSGTTEEVSADEFSGLTMSNFARRSEEMWKALLNYMNQKHMDSEGHSFIRESDFPENFESLVKFINNNADLSDNLLKNYIKECVKQEGNTHWNESVDKLIDYFYDNFQNNDKEIDSTNITIGDIKNADAGKSFIKPEWVIPWKNIDGDNYEDVRGNDKIARVLKDNARLQFTKKQRTEEERIVEGETEVSIYDYIRLIMPEYKRTVEIEDLNRNFWVIGQVLTGLCAFLFDEDSPLKNVFDSLLDEISQLWENVFYLWLTSIVENQKNYENIQTVFLPIAPFSYRPYTKYDNFYDGQILTQDYRSFYQNSTDYITDAKNRLKNIYESWTSYIKDKYKGTALAIIPEIRQINYAENYYARSVYLGIIIYDESVDDKDNVVQYLPFNFPIIVDLKNNTYFNPNASDPNVPFYCWYVDEDDVYYYIYSSLNDSSIATGQILHQLVRPHLSTGFTKENGIWKLLTGHNRLSFNDIGKDLSANIQITVVLEFNLNQQGDNIVVTPSAGPSGDTYSNIIEKNQGYYRGEVLSYFKKKIS